MSDGLTETRFTLENEILFTPTESTTIKREDGNQINLENVTRLFSPGDEIPNGEHNEFISEASGQITSGLAGIIDYHTTFLKNPSSNINSFVFEKNKQDLSDSEEALNYLNKFCGFLFKPTSDIHVNVLDSWEISYVKCEGLRLEFTNTYNLGTLHGKNVKKIVMDLTADKDVESEKGAAKKQIKINFYDSNDDEIRSVRVDLNNIKNNVHLNAKTGRSVYAREIHQDIKALIGENEAETSERCEAFRMSVALTLSNTLLNHVSRFKMDDNSKEKLSSARISARLYFGSNSENKHIKSEKKPSSINPIFEIMPISKELSLFFKQNYVINPNLTTEEKSLLLQQIEDMRPEDVITKWFTNNPGFGAYSKNQISSITRDFINIVKPEDAALASDLFTTTKESALSLKDLEDQNIFEEFLAKVDISIRNSDLSEIEKEKLLRELIAVNHVRSALG